MGYSYGKNIGKGKAPQPKKTAVDVYSKEELEKLTLKELKLVGAKYGTTDRSKDKLIEEILRHQSNK